jgi:hypothetical protein
MTPKMKENDKVFHAMICEIEKNVVHKDNNLGYTRWSPFIVFWKR